MIRLLETQLMIKLRWMQRQQRIFLSHSHLAVASQFPSINDMRQFLPFFYFKFPYKFPCQNCMTIFCFFFLFSKCHQHNCVCLCITHNKIKRKISHCTKNVQNIESFACFVCLGACNLKLVVKCLVGLTWICTVFFRFIFRCLFH